MLKKQNKDQVISFSFEDGIKLELSHIMRFILIPDIK
jgi:hypothetical protein